MVLFCAVAGRGSPQCRLPLMLNVVQVAAVLGISRAGAYELVHSEGFPTLKIGSRIVVPKDKLREWIDANTAQK